MTGECSFAPTGVFGVIKFTEKADCAVLGLSPNIPKQSPQ